MESLFGSMGWTTAIHRWKRLPAVTQAAMTSITKNLLQAF
jgi:hypothetical protein